MDIDGLPVFICLHLRFYIKKEVQHYIVNFELLYNDGFHYLLLSGSATVLGLERMKRERRPAVVNERLREIIAQVEARSDANHLKLLEPSQPVQILPKTSRSCGEDETPN
jgi:hypothetical protein